MRWGRKLSDVLHKLDEPSLAKLVRDHEGGHLEGNQSRGSGVSRAANPGRVLINAV
jgi:hypothetical protein